MQSIFVCNTASDSISEISFKDYSVKNYPLDLGEKPVGPHALAYCNGEIIICNNYNNSISIFNLQEKKERAVMYAGAHPNDIKIFKDKAYVVCGESDSVIKLDIVTGSLIANIPVGDNPHNIEINAEKGVAYVSNMRSNSVSVIDMEKDTVVTNIKTNDNPTKIFLSKDKKVLYLCESCLTKELEGYIAVVSTENNKIIKRIRVGITPADLVQEKGKIYVVNFNEGSLSIVDIEKGREVKKIYVGGMPKSIIKKDNDIFIGDYMNGRVYKINLKERIIKNITVGREPNAMILV